MNPVTVEHPLVDAGGQGWVGTETRADVVALTAGMSDFLSRVARGGDRPIIVTGEFSRMTQPLAEVLSAVQGHWVVRTEHDGFFDARSGVRLASPAAVLEGHRIRTPDDVHPLYLRAPVVGRLQLVATVSSRHRVSRPVRLGGVFEAASELLTGQAPAAWGGLEPFLAPWSREDLTERSRSRVPLDSRWAGVGGGEQPLVGTIHVARTSEGLEETTRVWADIAAAGDPRAGSIAQEAHRLLGRAAGIAMPLVGIAFAAIGAPDLSRRPTATAPPEPLALLIGPPGVRALGVDPRAWTANVGGTTVGSPRLPGVLLPLGSVDGGGWQRLSDIFATVEGDRLAQVLALAPQVSAQLRAANRGR
jgi:hypothetical protein